MNIRNFSVFITLLLLTVTASSQENNSKIFVKLIGGYAFLGPGSYTGANFTGGGKFEQSNQKFGQGFRGGVGVGYIVNENINLGLDVVYHKGRDLILTQNIENHRDSLGKDYIRTTNSDITTSYTHTILNFIPNIAFKAIAKPTYYVYNRIGVIVALPLDLNTTYKGYITYRTQNNPGTTQYDYSNNYTYDYDGNYSEDLAFGFQAALGVQFKLSENLRFFTELEASSLVLNPRELVYTTYMYTSNLVRNVPGPATLSQSTDTRIRHYFYQKSGVQKTELGTDEVTIYTNQNRIATNSLTANIGLALRL